MSWDERQKAMLRAMGLRLWDAPEGPAPGLPAALQAPAPPASSSAAAPAAASTPVVSAVIHAPTPTPAQHTAPATETLTLDWAGLRAAVSGCRACALCESRTQTVFGTGHPQAHWLIVGEAPGAQEDAQGEPFVGPSGQLLDNMLHALGLSRQPDGDPARRVYIANTLKCRPPGNRNPQPAEMQRCAPYLQRQIELLQPRVILALGRFAVQALLQQEAPLGQLRGSVHRLGQRPVVVSYHPSYLLRSPTEKAKAWADLCLAAATAEAQGQ